MLIPEESNHFTRLLRIFIYRGSIIVPFDSIIDESLKTLRRLQLVEAIESGGIRTGGIKIAITPIAGEV